MVKYVRILLLTMVNKILDIDKSIVDVNIVNER